MEPSKQHALMELYKKDPAACAELLNADLGAMNVIPSWISATGPIPPAPTAPPPANLYFEPETKIAMRMHWPTNHHIPDGVAVFQAYEIAGHTNAYVFIIFTSGRHVVLEDEAGLFPSDALITQLRVLGL